jgi:hypothetical protein
MQLRCRSELERYLDIQIDDWRNCQLGVATNQKTYSSSISGISVSPRMVNMIGNAPSGDLDFRKRSLMKSMYASASSVKPIRRRM